MPTNYIKISSNWKPISQLWTKISTTWKSVSQGWINVAGVWKQFFGASNTYVFNFGNTVHVGTNGYISLDGGQSTYIISSTVDRVLGILPADLEMNTVRWAASDTRFYVFWRGKRLSGGTDNEIQYEVHFINGQDYALIKLVSFPIITYSLTGYYYNGSSTGNSRITTTRTVGAEYRVYFNTTAAFATTFTEFGSSTHPVWLASSSVTSGGNDDGYFTIVANQGSSSQAPTSVTESNVRKTSATVSWTAPLRESKGMSDIQSYDYSTDGGSSWTSTSTNTTVDITGLTASTSYTVLVRANNYYFTGTNYGSVTFTTTAGPVNTVLPTLSTDTSNFSRGSVITVSEGTWTGTSSYKYEILYSANPAVPTDSSAYTANASNQYTITLSDATAPSYYFRAKVTGYDGANQTGDSAIAYGVVSSRAYIVPTTSISVGTATSTGFTISGAAGPVTSGARYVVISEIYIYNSSQTLISTITTGLPTPALTTGNWSYVWTGGAASTTYYAKVKVASTSSDVQYFTTAFSDSITTATAPTPNVSRITMTNGGGSTASPNSPRMSITITSTSAASIVYNIWTSSSLPIGLVSAGSGTVATSGSVTVTTNTGAFNNYYEVYVTPYSQASAQGTSGTVKYGGTKRNTTTSTTTTFNV
jgi:hypothetical protein